MMPEDDRRVANPKRSVQENSVNENAIPKKPVSKCLHFCSFS